jgi:hypothetical protein
MTPTKLAAPPASEPPTVDPSYTAFAGHKLIASGTREEMLRAAQRFLDRTGDQLLIFEASSGRQVDFDFRGTIAEVVERAKDSIKSGPGRPKLGVISREVSLLPRHWDWLESQPNGASAAIRKLIDQARHSETGIERGRHVRNAIGRFLWSMAGNFPNFEEVARALDAREDSRLDGLMSSWPKDVRSYVFDRVKYAAGLEGW